MSNAPRKPDEHFLAKIKQRFAYDREIGVFVRSTGSRGRIASDGSLVFAVYLGKDYDGRVRTECDVRGVHISWYLNKGVWPDRAIRCINGDKADTRIENLEYFEYSSITKNGRPKKVKDKVNEVQA